MGGVHASILVSAMNVCECLWLFPYHRSLTPISIERTTHADCEGFTILLFVILISDFNLNILNSMRIKLTMSGIYIFFLF